MEKLKIAIQKSGRLSDDSLQLLKGCGIRLSNGISKLKTEAVNFPLEVFFLRDDDIPQYVEDGVADAGIVGENILAEQKSRLLIKERLGFGKCRLSIAIPRDKQFDSPEDLSGIKIATSYPNILDNFLKERNIKAEIHVISGSVEIAPGIGLADAVCDLVSTGSTLFTNGLKENITIFRSEAVLASAALNATKNGILEKLMFRIRALKQASSNKYIMLNAPDEKLNDVCSVLPGIKSPTIMPLATKGWSSVHSVVQEDRFWEIIELLREKGAEGILVLPIEKMIS